MAVNCRLNNKSLCRILSLTRIYEGFGKMEAAQNFRAVYPVCRPINIHYRGNLEEAERGCCTPCTYSSIPQVWQRRSLAFGVSQNNPRVIFSPGVSMVLVGCTVRGEGLKGSMHRHCLLPASSESLVFSLVILQTAMKTRFWG